MNILAIKIGALLLVVGLIFGGGVWMGHRIGSQKARTITPAPAVILLDGSVMLATDAGVGVKPVQVIPPGAKAERIIKVVVRPGPASSPISGTAPPAAGTSTTPPTTTNPCPPIRIDLTLVKLKDGSHRVIASSPDGQIETDASLDIPVSEAPAPPKEKTWAVGGTYGAGTNGAKSMGPLVMRRILGPIWVGVELTRDTYTDVSAGWSGRAIAVVTF